MATKKISLRIVTPEKVKEEMDVDMAIVRATTGEMGFMRGHEALSAVLDYGALRIIDGGTEKRMAIEGGIVQVRDNVVNILTNSALWPDEIDRARAERQRAESEQELLLDKNNTPLQVLLRRSLVFLEVSAFPIINKPQD